MPHRSSDVSSFSADCAVFWLPSVKIDGLGQRCGGLPGYVTCSIWWLMWVVCLSLRNCVYVNVMKIQLWADTRHFWGNHDPSFSLISWHITSTSGLFYRWLILRTYFPWKWRICFQNSPMMWLLLQLLESSVTLYRIQTMSSTEWEKNSLGFLFWDFLSSLVTQWYRTLWRYCLCV